LAEISPLFLARAGAAILLALAIISTENLHLAGFAGLLGFYAIADGVFAAITWLRDRRFKLFAGEAIAGIVLGFAMLRAHGSATALLVLVALRAIALACVDALHARATLTPRDAQLPLVLAAACGVVGLGFLSISPFSYDALDLYACIAGYHALFGAGLLSYGVAVRRSQASPTKRVQRISEPRLHGMPR